MLLLLEHTTHKSTMSLTLLTSIQMFIGHTLITAQTGLQRVKKVSVAKPITVALEAINLQLI
jgi:hypothetical protein